ncbi:MAG: hypothetical protein GY725_24425 [bacterium]|nr:hypothetical protein [bacterium]
MIVYIHVPGFYAVIEQADDSGLRGRPVIVGGNPGKRGTVTSVSREAAQFDIVTGMRVEEALKLCPEAEIRPTRLKRYREVGAEIRALLRNEHERIEEFKPGGTFIEPLPSVDPVTTAAELCVRLKTELGLAACAGIGPSKYVAYMAANHSGESGLREVKLDEVREFLGGFAVTEIWGLGPSSAEKLAESGFQRISDLQDLAVEELKEIVGRNADQFLQLARGEDDDPLKPNPRPKSISQERTLDEPTVDLRSLGEEIQELAGLIETLLARERRAAGTLTLGLAYVDGTQITRTQSVDPAISTRAEIAEVALQLLVRARAGVRRARRLKLQVTRLRSVSDSGDNRQLRLF